MEEAGGGRGRRCRRRPRSTVQKLETSVGVEEEEEEVDGAAQPEEIVGVEEEEEEEENEKRSKRGK